MKIIASASIERSGKSRRAYFRCLSAYEGSGCTQTKFPYEAAERTILAEIAPHLSKLVVGVSSQPKLPRDFEGERAELKRKLDNLYDLYADQRTDTLRGKLAELEQSIRQLDGEETTAVMPTSDHKSLQDAAALFENLKSKGELDAEQRRRVRAVLKRIAEGAYFLVDGDRYTVAVKFYAGRGPALFLDVDVPRMYKPRSPATKRRTTTRS
jgi:hypothetical protein